MADVFVRDIMHAQESQEALVTPQVYATEGGSLAPDSTAVPAAPSPPDLDDAFDAQGASDELLEALVLKEARALRALRSAPGLPPAPLVRERAIDLISRLVRGIGLGQDAWFRGVALLDAAMGLLGPGVRAGKAGEEADDSLGRFAILTAAAAVRLQRKLEDADRMPLWFFFQQDPCMKRWLLEAEADIAHSEKALLGALGWELNLPTSESWARLFCTRLNILTENAHAEPIERAYIGAVNFARAIAARQAAGPELPPQRLAAGLVLIGLVNARLLPREVLRTLEGNVTPPRPSGAVDGVVSLLGRAAGLDPLELVRCAEVAAASARSAVEVVGARN